MKYLYSWLKEYYPEIPYLDILPDRLIQLGHEVESVEPEPLNTIVVAEIKQVSKHPNADRLDLLTVYDGEKEHGVVTGAPNVKVGQKVAFAPIHSVLPGGIIIRSAKIRDVVSEGMVCAADELGLSRDHSRLFALPDNAKIGDSVQDYIEQDAVINLAITSNRGDVLSHFGLARDLAAILGNKILKPEFKKPKWSGDSNEFFTIGQVNDDVLNINLAAATAEKPVATPLWMVSRLQRLGYRSINFATDITNYLLLSYGQPLHVYRRSALISPIVFHVRRGRSDETFHALNNEKYTLSPKDLVIANGDTPIALAGTIGGDSSKADSQEAEVIFESARFYPKTIGMMNRNHTITSESAQRFERGIDPTLTQQVLEEALALWQEYTQGKVYTPLTLNRDSETDPPVASFTAYDANKFLGTNFTDEKISSFLTALGGSVSNKDGVITVSPPSWRHDLYYPEDYYEEMLRSVSINDITKTALAASIPQWKRSHYWRTEAFKDMLVQLGAYEIRTYPFISEQQKKLHHFEDELPKLTMAPQEGRNILRPSLLPSTLEAIANNPETPFVILFEIATVFTKENEKTHLIIATASGQTYEGDNFWRHLFERLHLPVSSWMSRVKTVSSDIHDYYKIRKSEVDYLELPVDSLLTTKSGDMPLVHMPDIEAISYTPLGKFQASRRDIAIVVSAKRETEEISQMIRQFHPLIVAVELFDTYQDPKLGDDTVSYAFHIMYQSPDKTLSNEEITIIHKALEEQLKEQFNASIR